MASLTASLHGVALKPGCQLIHGQFAMLVQLFLGMLSLGSLGVKVMTAYALPGRSFCLPRTCRTHALSPPAHRRKSNQRYLELRRSSLPRTWTVWKYDTSKNACSALGAHFAGMIVALLVSHGGRTQCAWYLLTFTLDTTLGVTLSYVMLRVLQSVSGLCGCRSLRQSGYYGDPPRARWWLHQLGSWVLLVLLARLCCGVIIVTQQHVLEESAQYVIGNITHQSPVIVCSGDDG